MDDDWKQTNPGSLSLIAFDRDNITLHCDFPPMHVGGEFYIDKFDIPMTREDAERVIKGLQEWLMK